MALVRVFEVAKEYELDLQALLNVLKDQGVKVRSHMSQVDQEDMDRAVAALGKSKAEKKKDSSEGDDLKLKVRRRKKTDEHEAEAHHEPEAEHAAEPPPAHEEPQAAPVEEPAAQEPVAVAEEPGGEVSEPVAAEPAPEVKEPPKAEAPSPRPQRPENQGQRPQRHDQQKQRPQEQPRKKLEIVRPAPPPVQKPKPPAEQKPEEPGDKEFGLKVVRFIKPEERPEAFVPPIQSYNMTKDEREAQRADRKAKKKKGKGKDKHEKQRENQKTQITVPKAIKRRIRISDVITVAELAKRMGIKANEAIKTLIGLGILATINQSLDADTATLVASEFGYEIENVAVAEEDILTKEVDAPEHLKHRPPVVTVMGHVDHGKTSLLDAIRKTRVAAGESGGITQHIGAYKVSTSRGTLVFLDTPGHEAFTEMRARGAKLTDIVVLVVAANDGVMPQTIEAIHHSEAAKVPIIVAINKMDLPDSNPERVKRELADHGLITEEWGGDVMCVPVSAKKLLGIDDLLEMIALQAEVMELKANPDKLASGVVVEARLDKGRGPVATVLVQEGTLKLGDIVLSGSNFGRVRTLTNDTGKREKIATPGTPVEITGLDGVPNAGDTFVVLETERVAKEISSRRLEKSRESEMAQARKISLEDLHERIAEGAIKTLKLIVKGDVQGSVEALDQTFSKLSTPDVKVEVIHKGVGGIIESDVNLAIASEAIIVGFHVRAESKAQTLAARSGVDIRLYDVIYDATDDLKRAMTGLLAPRTKETALGRVSIRQIFRVPKVGTVAGCMVIQGTVVRNAKIRLVRDNVVIYEGTLSSLKRFKDDVREVREGFECGLSIDGYNDLKVGDEIECYQIEQVAATL